MDIENRMFSDEELIRLIIPLIIERVGAKDTQILHPLSKITLNICVI